MSKYRHCLPQLDGVPFLTDGGLETTLLYHDRIDLPCFAAFHLLRDEAGTAVLRDYFVRYTRLARDRGVGIVLESPTWRANPDWAAKLGYDAEALADANRRGIGLLLEVRAALETPDTSVVISGNLGPRGDGYVAGARMTAREAQDYHVEQIETFAATDADMVAAFTMNYVEEAVGITRAAKAAGMPLAISFTVETDGRLPSGDSLAAAIERTDAESGGGPAYYMINCAHPTHFADVLRGNGEWCRRIRGLRANASRRSHAELDASTDLDSGDPDELAADYRRLRSCLPALTVLGGCCGTDHRHVAAIGDAWLGRRAAPEHESG
jgi:S-methylmethionine-dependent homocysteine/selenocysteine methylase